MTKFVSKGRSRDGLGPPDDLGPLFAFAAGGVQCDFECTKTHTNNRLDLPATLMAQ